MNEFAIIGRRQHWIVTVNGHQLCTTDGKRRWFTLKSAAEKAIREIKSEGRFFNTDSVQEFPPFPVGEVRV